MPLASDKVYERVKDIKFNFGKLYSYGSDKILWKKRLIFFYLHNQRHLFVRYNLDMIHVEKNIYNSLIRMLLNMPGKNGVKSKLNLPNMVIKLGLALEKRGPHRHLFLLIIVCPKRRKQVLLVFAWYIFQTFIFRLSVS